jgi:hypothetical protein
LTDRGSAGHRVIGFAFSVVAGAVVAVATFVAAFRVHGFYIGCGENESPFGNTAPTCFDPLGYNNHLPFRLLLVLGSLVVGAALVMVGRRFAAEERPG